MVVARTNDACVEGFCPHTRLRFLYSDVSETAARLQVQHGNCLASGSVLARALAGIALVGIDLGEQDETISMHAEVNGRVGGFFAEMTGRGELRGYTHNTDFDALPPPEPDIPDPCGTVARVKLTRTHESGRVRSQMSFSVSPASEQNILVEFYNATMQIPTQVCLHAAAAAAAAARAVAADRADHAARTGQGQAVDVNAAARTRSAISGAGAAVGKDLAVHGDGSGRDDPDGSAACSPVRGVGVSRSPAAAGIFG